MFLTDPPLPRADQDSHGNLERGVDATCGADLLVIANCRSFLSRHSDLLAVVERMAEVETVDDPRLIATLGETCDELAALVPRIGATPASTSHGVRSKHAVAQLLLSFDKGESLPDRDAFLLSFIKDVDELFSGPAADRMVLEHRQVAEAETAVSTRQACLVLADQIRATFLRLEHEDLLACAAQERVASELLALLRQWRSAIADLAETAAVGYPAVRMKARVLQSVLEMQDSGVEGLGVALASSYLDDLGGFLTGVEQDSLNPSPPASFWNALSSGFRRLTAGVFPF